MERDPSLRSFEITGTGGFFFDLGMLFPINGTGGSLIRKVRSLKTEIRGFFLSGWLGTRVPGAGGYQNHQIPAAQRHRKALPCSGAYTRASERARARVCCCCCWSRWMTRRRRHYSLLHADMSHLQQLPHAPPPRRRVQTNACCCLQSVGDPYRPMRRWKNFLVLVSCPRGARTSISRKLTKRRRIKKKKAYCCAKNQRDVCKPLRRTWEYTQVEEVLFWDKKWVQKLQST